MPLIHGTENEWGIDISKLRETANIITHDPGFGNTGSCESEMHELLILFILHAEHEQSTATVRTLDSAGINLFASLAGGVNALWGPLNGGANMEVIKMLQEINISKDTDRIY